MRNKTFKILYLVRVAACLGAFALLAFALPAQAAENWTSYENGRFGYSVDHPDIFDAVKEPDNGDGAEFESADGEYALTVWGGYNILEDDGNSLLEKCYDRVAHIVPDSEKSGQGFYSIEYSDDGGKDGVEHIFHEYGVVNADTQAGFILKYPKEEEKRFAEIKKRMETSLKIPEAGESEAGETVDVSAFELKDGKVYKKGAALDCEVFDVLEETEGPIQHWSVFSPDANGAVSESETGVFFFSGEGVCLTFVPLVSEYELQIVTFSPDGGRFILGRGSGVRPDLTYEVYGEGTEKIAEFGGIRGDIQWIDPARFALTRIDEDIREGGSFENLSYGLRLSVVMYDAGTKETTVLKESTDTQNYSFASVTDDGSAVTVIEQSVKSEADWGDEDKIEERVFEVEIPAAG
jgi:hypothetical protein